MPFDFASFINPNQFSDAGTLAGFDPNQQMNSIRDVAAKSMGVPTSQSGGAVPPQTFGEIAQQRFDNVVAPITQAYNKASNTAEQLGQGNVVNAYNAYKGVEQSPLNSNVFDYSVNPFRKSSQ